MKKILIYTAGILLSLIIGFLILWWSLIPSLPPQTNEIIDEVLHSPLPELVSGQTGYAHSGELKIWFEFMQPQAASKGAVLLIMGISADMLSWPPYFYQPLLDSGYQVIRFDNRSTGRSEWIEDGSSFTLEDMARDGIAVLEELGVERAHVVGVSMGGMIAQSMAIHYPERLSGFTSIMSTGYIDDPELPSVDRSMFAGMAALYLRYGLIGGEREQIKMRIGVQQHLSNRPMADDHIRTVAQSARYNILHNRQVNPRAIRQQSDAIEASGPRYDGLKRLKMPVLIIHGLADPLIPPAHGFKCAELIPGAESLWLEDMGHSLPPEFVRPMLQAVIEVMKH